MRTLLLVVMLAACGPVAPDAVCDLSLEMYRDKDGDGFGGGAPQTMCWDSPGWVVNGLDCADEDPRAFPGQTEWQTVPIMGATTGGLQWDFDCDGVETQRWRYGISCYATGSSCYITTPPVPTPDGDWDLGYPAGDTPACGATAQWLYSCRAYGTVCLRDADRRVQACL